MNVHAIISARRSFEFDVDDIRLTVLSHRDVVEAIQEYFKFEAGEMTTPPEVFGPVSPTMPPGLVFVSGLYQGPLEDRQTIRMLTVEARRIVIDLAAPSDAIDGIFEEFRAILDSIKSAYGAPAIGASTQSLDYSEISFRSEGLLSKLVVPEVGRSIKTALARQFEGLGLDLVPSVRLRPLLPATEYGGSQAGDPASFIIDLRGGSTLEKGVLYSGAPLPTAEHIQYLEVLENSLMHG